MFLIVFGHNILKVVNNMYQRIMVIALMLGMICGIIFNFPANALDDKPTIYLTFDDGPSVYTSQVLDILDRYDIKATFFVTADNPEYFDEITNAYQQGHVIGLHTASHSYATIYKSVDAYFTDLELISEVVEQRTGKKSTYIRFPGGSSNTISEKYHHGIMAKLVSEVDQRGYQYFDWNAEIGDAKKYHSVSSIIETGKKQGDGKHDMMLLCHDGNSNQDTVKALPTLLTYYLSLGYQFKTIDDSTPVFHHHIAD